MNIKFDYQCFTNQVRGGISRYFSRLALEYERKGLGCSIIAGLYTNIYLTQVKELGLVRGIGPLAKIPYTTKLARVLNTTYWNCLLGQHCDIYHSTYYQQLRAPRRARVIHTVYDFIHERFPGTIANSNYWIAQKISALNKADLVISISHSTKADLAEFIPSVYGKCLPIHLGVDADTKPIWAPVKSKPFFLFIGDRGGYKNFELIRKLFINHQDIRQAFRLVCFGGGNLKNDELINGVDILSVGGSDDILKELLSTTSALFYPSLYEGFGLPILEAYAVGCPVFCVRGSSIDEVAGNQGIYVDGKDSESLYEKIMTELEITSQTPAILARHSRALEFSWAKCAEKTLAAYSSLA